MSFELPNADDLCVKVTWKDGSQEPVLMDAITVDTLVEATIAATKEEPHRFYSVLAQYLQQEFARTFSPTQAFLVSKKREKIIEAAKKELSL